MQQSYVTPAPVCAECPPTSEPALLANANVYLAAGTHVFTMQAVASSEEADSLAVLFQVARTFRVDNGQTPTDTASDLVALYQSHSDNCVL